MTTEGYREFLEGKAVSHEPCGFEPEGVSEMLFPFQRDIVRWACRKGKAAVFADCGLGKTAMQRTKALGLLNKQKNKDSAMSRQGIPDYLVTMRKPGDNPEPISHTNDEFPVSVWQRLASPVWMDINPSNTLNYRTARENEDERHICPLQLDVIERAIDMWSKPGDMVLSPFMGIGSEGYVAVSKGRRFTGIELKPSYWGCAVSNLRAAEAEASSKTLLDFMEVSA